MYGQLKKPDDAVRSFEKAMQLDPKRPDAYLFVGLTYLQSDRYAEAVKSFKAGIHQDPKKS